MAFYAASFIYDGISSLEYGLRISSMGEQDESAGANVELITQSVFRRNNNFLLGVKQSPALEIPITITVEKELSAMESSEVSSWLFGRENYKKLQIVQPDMEYIYFNCIIANPSVIKIGNIIRGYNATIICDSPFAYEYKNSTILSFDNYLIDEDVVAYNGSDSSDYYYPVIRIKTNVFGGYLKIINYSDKNRVFGLKCLPANTSICIDNSLQMVYNMETNENYLNALKQYDYKWFRYIKGINNLNIKGNISYLEFVNNFQKKIS